MASLFKPSKSSVSASSSPIPLTPTLIYHQLVWKNDLPALTALIREQQALLTSKKPSSSSSPSTPVYDINSQDRYGNTPLLLAVQLGHTAAASLLLSAGAATKYRNGSGWSPVQEALSRGDRDLIRLVVTTWMERSENEFLSRVPDIMRRVEAIGDFYLEVDWRFSSWVPLLGRVLPSDRWRIWKKGTRVRVDTSLVDFSKSSLSWKRGSLSLLFTFKAEAGKAKDIKGNVDVVALDHIHRVYTRLSKDEDAGDARQHQHHAPESAEELEELEELEERIDDLMSSPLTAFTSPGVVEFVRQKAGIWGWRSDKVEDVNGYSCRVFDVKNLNLQTEKRVEHLTDEERDDIEKLHTAIHAEEEPHGEGHKELEDGDPHADRAITDGDDDSEAHAAGGGDDSKDAPSELLQVIEEPKKPHRPSLPAPPSPSLASEEYFRDNTAYPPFVLYNPATQQHPFLPPPLLSRPHQTTVSRKSYNASVWMTDDFPLRTETVVAILDLVAPHQRHVEKVRNFIESRLPPGFPVRIKMPIFPTITAEIQFVEYSDRPIDDAEMTVPPTYREDEEQFARFIAVSGRASGEDGGDR